MQTVTLPPSEEDLARIRAEIQGAKRQAEYNQLKRDLQDITHKAANTSNESDKLMQLPDIDTILKSQRDKPHSLKLFLDRVRGMFSVRPIIGNIIALLIAGIALFYIFDEVNVTGFGKYQSYFAMGIEIFAAIQIIKSATRGLLLPFLALTIGGTIAHSLGADQSLLHFNKAFYEGLMITGIIGLGVAVLCID